MSQFPKHDKILVLAAKEIGIAEVPDGSNSGPRVRWYQAATWLGGSFWPWCAAFCCRMAEQAGFKLAYKGAGAYAWYDDGAQLVGKKIPRSGWKKVIPGDFAVWALGAGHISIVERIDPDGTVHSIDGNVSNMVARRSRPLDQVYGFVHLDEAAVKPPKPVTPPTFEVVSSESGTAQVFYSGGDATHVAERIKAILKRHPEGILIRPRPKKK